MKTLIFATTNPGKLTEAKTILEVDVEGVGLEIDEVQSLDPIVVATKKALAYFKQIKKPVFIDDVALTFSALEGLPGTYINDFRDALGNDGLLELLKHRTDRKAAALTTIAYVNESGDVHVFQGRVEGTIAQTQRGDKGFGWDPIFIPDGSEKTFGEMELEEKTKYSMRAIALEKFKKWLSENQ